MNKSGPIASLTKEMNFLMRKAQEVVDMVLDTMCNAVIHGDGMAVRGAARVRLRRPARAGFTPCCFFDSAFML